MKELSIEEKAKAYDKAIERAKKQLDGAKVFDYEDEQIAHDIRTTTYDIFPELKESEDERMKNVAIRACKYMIDNFENSTKDYEDAIAWLEKQCEQTPAWSEEDENIIRTIISDGIRGAEFDMLQIDWLKSLKERYTWKPSEEQMGIIAQSVAVLKVSGYDELGDRLGDISEQLNKLKG